MIISYFRKGSFIVGELIVFFSLLILHYYLGSEKINEIQYIVKIILFLLSLVIVLSLLFSCEIILFKVKLDLIRYGGSFLFHVGLIFFFLAFIYKGLFGFSGVIQVMKGEKVLLRPESFVFTDKGFFTRFPFSSAISLMVDEILCFWKNDKLEDVKVKLVLYDHIRGKSWEGVLDFGSKVDFDGTKLHLGGNVGYVVNLLFIRSDNGLFTSTYFFLEKMPDSFAFRGEGELEMTPYYLEIFRFYPDGLNEKNPNLSAPVIENLRVRSMNRLIGEYTLFPSQSIKLQDGEIKFAGVSIWSDIVVIKNEGVFGVYVGGILSFVGGVMLAIHYLVSLRNSR